MLVCVYSSFSDNLLKKVVQDQQAKALSFLYSFTSLKLGTQFVNFDEFCEQEIYIPTSHQPALFKLFHPNLIEDVSKLIKDNYLIIQVIFSGFLLEPDSTRSGLRLQK